MNPSDKAFQLTLRVPLMTNSTEWFAANCENDINARLVNPCPMTTLDACRRTALADIRKMQKMSDAVSQMHNFHHIYGSLQSLLERLHRINTMADFEYLLYTLCLIVLYETNIHQLIHVWFHFCVY